MRYLSKRHLLHAGGAAAAFALSLGNAQADTTPKFKHVLLISIDGLHAIDLQSYITNHPQSTMSQLSHRGITYSNALTTAPSDSFPGMVAQVTGGTPKSADVFYDVSYDRKLYAPGSNCAGTPGTVTTFDESIDYNSLIYTGGGTLGKPLTQINPVKLPLKFVDGKCSAVYPHDFVKVNTIFEVIHAHGGLTAWADKHPAYEILNGPSGKGIDDLFTPEVDSNDQITGQDNTNGFHSIQRNDEIKVKAVLNEIAGWDSIRQKQVGIPAIFGMNFQAVSVGEKLAKGNSKDPADAGLIGGYVNATGTEPASGLRSGLDFVDEALHQMVASLKRSGSYDKTLIIISAKHGQSPIDRTLRKAFDDSPYGNVPGIDAYSTDDLGLVWLKPGLQQDDYAKAEQYLQANASKLGIVELLDRQQLSTLYKDPFNDNRTPDFLAVTQHGLIYTGGTKLAEHGGLDPDDRHVGLLLSWPSARAKIVADNVETRQIAPTILTALGYDPKALQAVQIEGTQTLPAFN